MDAKQVVQVDAAAVKNGLPCTHLCKCYAKGCTNMQKDTQDIQDDDADDAGDADDADENV